MTGPQPLSKAEMEVARIVWERGQATVREVVDALPADRNIDYKTVQTYLRRLEAKGYLAGQRRGRSTVYTPKLARSKVVRETVRDFVNRLFGGESLSLVLHLIEDSRLKADEIRQLRDLVDRLEKQHHGDKQR